MEIPGTSDTFGILIKSSDQKREKRRKGAEDLLDFVKFQINFGINEKKYDIYFLLRISCLCVNCKCKLSSSITKGSKSLLNNANNFRSEITISCNRYYSTFLSDFLTILVTRKRFCKDTRKYAETVHGIHSVQVSSMQKLVAHPNAVPESICARIGKGRRPIFRR